MSKFKGKFISERMFRDKGVKWASELLFFEFASLALAYNIVDFAEAVDDITSRTLRMGGRLENIYHELPTLRNAATFINLSTEETAVTKVDFAQIKRMKFDAVAFISIIRGMRNNSIRAPQVGRYLINLSRQLNVSNAQLRNFASLIMKFHNLPIKQQVETAKLMRNYASAYYRGTESQLLTNAVHNFLNTEYNLSDKEEAETTGGKDKSKILGVEKSTLANAAALGVVALGSYKVAKGITNIVTGKSDPSWAAKIASKADHRGFDDLFRK